MKNKLARQHILCVEFGRLRVKRDGTRAKTRFHLSPKRTSPFKSVGASVPSTTGSRGVRISVSNAGYTMFRSSVKSNGYPLHSLVSPSLPLPCVTVCHQASTGLCALSHIWSGDLAASVSSKWYCTRKSNSAYQLPWTYDTQRRPAGFIKFQLRWNLHSFASTTVRRDEVLFCHLGIYLDGQWHYGAGWTTEGS
jgi:hypothetical protein